MGRRMVSLTRACPYCGAGVGEKCRVWRVAGGERVSVVRYRTQAHPARTGR
jgi:hypothetical protein